MAEDESTEKLKVDVKTLSQSLGLFVGYSILRLDGRGWYVGGISHHQQQYDVGHPPSIYTNKYIYIYIQRERKKIYYIYRVPGK